MFLAVQETLLGDFVQAPGQSGLEIRGIGLQPPPQPVTGARVNTFPRLHCFKMRRGELRANKCKSGQLPPREGLVNRK